MREPTYPFARLVAEKADRALTERLTATRGLGRQDAAPAPDVRALEAIIEAAFWASLRREEGYPPKISLAYVSPAHSDVRLMLERPLPLTSEELTRLAPAVERPGIHLGVWHINGELSVWGATRMLPASCFVLEVASPGVLVIKFSPGEETSKFLNFAVLESDQVKMVNRDATKQPGIPPLLLPLLGLGPPAVPAESADIPARLAVSMRAHGRGGSLLVVPAHTQAWRQSVLEPIRYSVMPAFARLAELLQDSPDEQHSQLWQERVQRAVDAIAGLTAVDGATIINDRYELLAFGASIRRRDGADQAERVLLTELIEDDSPRLVQGAQFWGNRHLSAVQFVHDQHDAVALVASQDSRFTVFAWSPGQSVVQAHRVDAFLL